MKKALVIIPRDAAGGAENVAVILARELARQPDWRVHVMALSSPAYCFYLTKLPNQIEVSYGKGGGYLGSELGLPRRLRGSSYDLVFSTHLRVNAFLCIYRRLGILCCHRMVTRESTLFRDRLRRYAFWPYRLAYKIYGAQDAIIAQTPYMARQLASCLRPAVAAKIKTVPNPVDLDGISVADVPGHPEVSSGLTLIWCGRLITVKRPHIAIETLELLRRTVFPARLLFIGDGPLRGELERQVDKLGLSDVVTFVGHVENPAEEMIKGTHGIITSSSEGFPNVLLEMLACGLEKVFVTPCTPDIGELPGVRLSDGFSATNMATLIEGQMVQPADSAQEIQSMLQHRSPRAFTSDIVGKSGQHVDDRT